MKQDKREKRKQRVNIIMTIIVGVLMVASIAGYAIIDNGSVSGNLKYNKNSFSVIQDNYGNSYYRTKINNKYMDFYYYPSDIERINYSSDITPLLKNSQAVVFAFDPNDNSSDDLVFIDTIRYDLGQQLDKPTYFGILNASSNYQLPVISCMNASYYTPMFIINISTDTGFEASSGNPYCIYMNAKLKDILAAKDRIVYTYYGVMQ